MMEKKRIGTIFYALFFLTSLLIELYLLLEFRSDIVSLVLVGVVVLIATYLMLDSIKVELEVWQSMQKNPQNFSMNENEKKNNDKMLTHINNSIIQLNTNQKEISESFNNLNKSLTEQLNQIQQDNHLMIQEMIDTQKLGTEASIQYNKENAKQIVLNYRQDIQSLQEQTMQSIEILEKAIRESMHPLAQTNKESIQPVGTTIEQPRYPIEEITKEFMQPLEEAIKQSRHSLEELITQFTQSLSGIMKESVYSLEEVIKKSTELIIKQLQKQQLETFIPKETKMPLAEEIIETTEAEVSVMGEGIQYELPIVEEDIESELPVVEDKTPIIQSLIQTPSESEESLVESENQKTKRHEDSLDSFLNEVFRNTELDEVAVSKELPIQEMEKKTEPKKNSTSTGKLSEKEIAALFELLNDENKLV